MFLLNHGFKNFTQWTVGLFFHSVYNLSIFIVLVAARKTHSMLISFLEGWGFFVNYSPLKQTNKKHVLNMSVSSLLSVSLVQLLLSNHSNHTKLRRIPDMQNDSLWRAEEQALQEADFQSFNIILNEVK